MDVLLNFTRGWSRHRLGEDGDQVKILDLDSGAFEKSAHGIFKRDDFRIMSEDMPRVILFIFGSFLLGAVIRTALKRIKLPYTVLVCMAGIGFGALSIKYPLVNLYTETLANINPRLLIHAFMPVLIFSSAFEIESHIFLKSLSQVVLLAGPGLVLSGAMIALLAVKVYTFNWDWYVGMMFGSILACTDPITAVGLLRSLGANKALTLLIEGESLLNDGTSIVMFEVFRDLSLEPNDVDATELAVRLLLKVLVSPIFGYAMSKITMFGLTYIFNDGLTEITISLALTYVTFYTSKHVLIFTKFIHKISIPHMKIEYLTIDSFQPSTRSARCPDCEKAIAWEPSVREIDDMMEEARIRLLKAQKTSYWRQYSAGMLNRQAARALISITENTIDSGRFMTVIDVKKQWEAKGIVVAIRQKLEDWMYNVKVDKYKPSKNRFSKFCYRMVYNNTFECFMYMIILLNIFPIILEYIPEMNVQHALELRLTNYVFFIVYVTEAVMKIIAVRKAYIFDHWNQFDLFIITLAAADLIIDHLFERSEHKVRAIRVFRLIRLARVLRLLKIMLPTFIHLLNKQINKQLCFGYDIGKGYVVGEEDVNNLIDHISDQRVISEQLRSIVERNHQDAIKELGLLQRDHPEIAISVKTRQAARTVLNSARDTIHALMSGGLLDDAEASKLEEMIEIKMKRLVKFPPSIQPPTAEELLKNLPWLQNADKQIEFIKYRAKLLYFDYGDIVVHQGEQPRGIHLIVSGMVRLHGVKPSLGTSSKGLEIDDEEDDDIPTDKDGPTFTDYRSSGAIIGELNCLTQQRMEVTVTCETVAQTCYISIDDLFEAFDVFSEYPSLEYKIWLALGIRTAVTIMLEDITYQGWAYNSICAYLVRSYIVDIEKNNKFDLYDGTVEDAFLVYGSAEDVQSQKQYDAPCYISKTTHQVLGLANINKVLVVGAGMRHFDECNGGPCPQHSSPSKSASKSARYTESYSASQMEIHTVDTTFSKLTQPSSMLFPRMEGGRLQTSTSIANVKLF
ncbi:sodium/hydrogen exchanger 10-like [Amblyraja radiata]|uniref:sodium/hydrogen exchanger 10-like n=1 Tax=Amblyraja radiata TaxID=386614 RepID=UPI001401D07E|nr:sodium/hydrogen exchanger 10-like [Amblyraja radiata]